MQRALHGDLAAFTMFDMDGVLTAEVAYNEPDVESYDELRAKHQNHPYWFHLHHAPPFLIPTQPILSVVTGRMAMYKAQTLEWLERYDVTQTLGLYMSVFSRPGHRPSRDRPGNTAWGKAGAYEQDDARLFIESKRWQAEQIFKLVGKPVFCIENMRLYGKMN